jgi:hypothetical protein
MLEHIVTGPVEFKVVLVIIFPQSKVPQTNKKNTLLSRHHPAYSKQHCVCRSDSRRKIILRSKTSHSLQQIAVSHSTVKSIKSCLIVQWVADCEFVPGFKSLDTMA